jgi:serine/threonine-protein phosphatase 2A activator
MKFTLEPAGSHGVWGLDDYHFLPFLLGGAELIGHDVVKKPSDIHNKEYVEAYHNDYMYLDCIKVIKEVKKSAPFSETSPMLNDISAAASWEKIAMVRISN